MSETTCAFCKGTGKDPFRLLSELAICQVCSGEGKAEIKDPHIRCAYCLGTGVSPLGARITCAVCGGKGVVFAKKVGSACTACKGSGRTSGSELPCLACHGRGTAEVREEMGESGKEIPE